MHARFVECFLPAGLEQFFLETGEPITDLSVPQTEPATKPSMKKLLDGMAKYHIDIVGPIPE